MTERGSRKEPPQDIVRVAGDINTIRDVKNVDVINQGRGRVTVVTRYGSDETEITRRFLEIYRRIDKSPEDPNVEQDEIARTVKDIETEVGEKEPNIVKIRRWLGNLVVAPIIRKAVLELLADAKLRLSDSVSDLAQTLLH